jgi:hypothetical protein
MTHQLFIDTEFNGFGGALISMALVSWPRGFDWYECMETADPYDEWVAANVIPILGKPPLSKKEFRASFKAFISWFDRPEIICDWHTDIMHFCSLLEGESFEDSIPFNGTFKVIHTPEEEPKSDVPHNALSDAKALMYWHLEQLQGGK